jgi:hypothetical protein
MRRLSLSPFGWMLTRLVIMLIVAAMIGGAA